MVKQGNQMVESDLLHEGLLKASDIINEVKKAVIGKDEIIKKVLIAILSKGHILLEDIPGVGKTTLALAFSKAMQLSYNRVQFTPDVMPSDVTGYSIYKKSTDSFDFVSGAAMCNLFLADEINRASSKTQSALLEVMEEGRITVDTKTYDTPKPFTVIATQNPIGHAGTQMLPESQIDRFLMRISMGYPDKRSEFAILKSKRNNDPLESITPVASASDILLLQNMVENIHVADEIYDYMIELISKTRNSTSVELGASPRGTLALMTISKANAFFSGRDYVLPVDVVDGLIDAAGHRLIMKSKAKIANVSAVDILEDILKSTKAPKI